VTKPQVISKPVTPHTLEPPKPADIILKTTVSTDSNKQQNSDVLSSILPPPMVKDKVPHTTKEKTIVKDIKTTLKDKTGFVLPTPKPTTTKSGMCVSIVIPGRKIEDFTSLGTD
jgi:hypothetical protein